MKKIFIENPYHFQQINFEFLNLASIKHENIMPLRSVEVKFSSSNIPDHVCIFTDFYEDGDLSRYIQKRKSMKEPFREEEIFKMISSLVEAFSYLQRMNLAHRDIKPENIFVTDEGKKFIVGDFGSSKLKNDRLGQTLVGTPLYLSPILRSMYDKNDFTVEHDIFKSDVFSLGMSVLYMSTFCDLRFLYNSKKRSEEIKNLIKKITSRKVKAILKKMLEIDEVKRPDFLHLQNFLKSFHDIPCEVCNEIDLNPHLFEGSSLCEKCYSLKQEILKNHSKVFKKHQEGNRCQGIRPDKTCTCGQRICLYCKNLSHDGQSCLEATKTESSRQNYFLSPSLQTFLPSGSYFLENPSALRVCVVCSEFFNNDSHERCVFFFTNVELN
jgi:serine/threonine protein kinase